MASLKFRGLNSSTGFASARVALAIRPRRALSLRSFLFYGSVFSLARRARSVFRSGVVGTSQIIVDESSSLLRPRLFK